MADEKQGRRTVEQVKWPLVGMTVEETAEALRVHPRTIMDMLRDGRFPGRKVGNGWRIDPDAVKRWLGAFENVEPFKEFVDIEERTPDGKAVFSRYYRYENATRQNGATVWEENPKFVEAMKEMEQAKKNQ